MKLAPESGNLFYQLWLPLLDFVNETYQVNPGLGRLAEADSMDPAEVKAVADVLWDNTAVLDEYLSSPAAMELPEKHRAIVAGWKRRVKGRFAVERHLKMGSILISLEDEQVYQVGGIKSSLEEMFPYVRTPFLIEAVLIPFGHVVITDGLNAALDCMVGSNMAQSFKDLYMKAKKEKRIRRSL